MKSPILRLWLVLAAFASPVLRGASAPIPVAVFAFQADSRLERTYGAALATLVIADLQLLEPFRPSNVRPEANGLTFDDAPNAALAAALGHNLGAQALVTGRILSTGQHLILTAKVIDPATGTALGTSVEGKTSDPVTGLAAELSVRIAGVILHESPESAHTRWPVARIEGWAETLHPIGHGLLPQSHHVSVAAIDGIPVAKASPGQLCATVPGRHRVSAVFSSGSTSAHYEFYCDFRPGVGYALHGSETSSYVQLWLSSPGVEHVTLLARQQAGGGLVATLRLDRAISQPYEESVIDTRMIQGGSMNVPTSQEQAIGPRH